MRTRLTTAALAAGVAAALAAGVPERAVAQTYGGQLALRYDRFQTWQADGGYRLAPTLQFDGGVGAESYVVAPDLLHWSANLSYLAFRDGEGLDNASNALGYAGALELFQSARSVTPVTVTASRANVDHAFTLSTGDRATGTTTVTSYGLSTALSLPQRPSLRVGASRYQEENSGLGRPPDTQTTEFLTAGVRHSPGPYELDASYDGRFRTGTLPVSNFDEHNVRMIGTAAVSQQISAYAQESYQKRTATTVDGFNPTSENNTFTAGVRGRELNDQYRWFANYDYSHFFIESPGVERSEQLSHGLIAQADRRFSAVWSGTAAASANATQVRLGNDQQLAAGQSLTGLATWTEMIAPEQSLLLEAGPRVGAIEPAGGSAELAYGAQGRARWSLARAWRSAVEYQITYGNNVAALAGWSLSQRLRGDFGGLLAPGLRFSAYVAADGSRLHNDLLGDTLSQSLQTEAQLYWRKYSLLLGFLYAATPQVFSSGTASDGLFIPAKFASTSRSGYASLGVPITRRLVLQTGARYSELSGAGIPAQQELGVFGVITYSLGLLSLSIDDRYTAGGANSFDNRSNALYVRLSRVFYGRF